MRSGRHGWPSGSASRSASTHQFGPAVGRVLGIRHEAVFGEQIRYPLDALHGDAEHSANLGDDGRSVLDSGEDEPSSARLAHRFGQGITGGDQESTEADHRDRELAESITGWRPGDWTASERRFPRMLSFRLA